MIVPGQGEVLEAVDSPSVEAWSSPVATGDSGVVHQPLAEEGYCFPFHCHRLEGQEQRQAAVEGGCCLLSLFVLV